MPAASGQDRDDRRKPSEPDATKSKPHRWQAPVSSTGQSVCDLCGSPMRESHCKLVCDQCGYVRDCSDP
jgi:hypothetical protein